MLRNVMFGWDDLLSFNSPYLSILRFVLILWSLDEVQLSGIHKWLQRHLSALKHDQLPCKTLENLANERPGNTSINPPIGS